MRLLLRFLPFFVPLILFLPGCSTTIHGPLPSQAYHDITSHYNAYFNANEKLKATFKTLNENHKDNYKEILPVYAFSDPKEAASFSGDCEDVIKRSTLAIQLHETSNWSDDAMLLVGKANFVSGEYDKALSAFKYITSDYKEGVNYNEVRKKSGKKTRTVKPKKRKPKPKPDFKYVKQKDGSTIKVPVDNRPEYTLWKHEPTRPQALVWMIMTYTRQKKYSEAASLVAYAENDKKFYKNCDKDLALANADLRIQQGAFPDAITALEKYLQLVKKKGKKKKTRATFILAQLYAKTGNTTEAAKVFAKVLKLKPGYDMEFNARMGIARLSRGGAGGNATVKSLLAKMLKDDKYRDYFDQIYYELALVSLSENDRTAARQFLKKSVAAVQNNSEQKALSFRSLADLDFEDEYYVSAKMFYDSTLQEMAPNAQGYTELEDRNKILARLVSQISIIDDQDSLLALAALPAAELKKKVAQAAAAQDKAEEENEGNSKDASSPAAAVDVRGREADTQPKSSGNTGLSASSWYFYNTTARSQGYNDFIKRWGKRKLEEFWRRKDKSSSDGFAEEEIAAQDSITSKTGKETNTAEAGSTEEQMMNAIPLTDEARKASENKIVEACYTAGGIYKDELLNLRRAAEMYNKANQRFPNHKLMLECLYSLYLIAGKSGDASESARLKDIILRNYPGSKIAQFLRDPSYFDRQKREERKQEEYYEQTFALYLQAAYDSAMYRTKYCDVLFKPNPLRPQYDLLQALIIGKQNKLDEYTQALNKVISRHENHPVKNLAAEYLAALNRSKFPMLDLSKVSDSLFLDSLNKIYAPDIKASAPQNTLLPSTARELKTDEVDNATSSAVPTISGNNNTTSPPDSAASTKGTTAPAQKDKTPENTVTAPMVPPANLEPVDTVSIYKRASETDKHIFIVYLRDVNLNPSGALMQFRNYCNSDFPQSRLSVKSVFADEKTRLLTIRTFEDKAAAEGFFRNVKGSTTLYEGLPAGQYESVIMSQSNFDLFLADRNMDTYLKFFRWAYKL